MRKFQVASIVCICLAFAGCTNQQDKTAIAAVHEQLRSAHAENANLKVQNGKLKAQVAKLASEVKKLSDTPLARLQVIRELVAKHDLTGSSAALIELSSKYPNAKQTQVGKHIVHALSMEIKAEQKRRTQLQRLKFRAIKITPAFTYNDLKFQTLKTSTTNRWVSDAYHDEYHYSDADRGTKYIVLRVNISATQDKDPNLFPVGVYRVVGDKLERVAEFSYAFRRWHDYGSYLGNYSDSGNDFAKSKTVRFTLAAQVADSNLKESLMVVASNEQCVRRINRNLSPAIAYIELSCSSLTRELTLSTVASEEYHVIKRINF